MRLNSLLMILICSISCAQQTPSRACLTTTETQAYQATQEFHLDPQIQSYIVAFEQPPALKASGNSINNYNVKSLKISKLNERTFTFEVPTGEFERAQAIQTITQVGRIQFLEPDYEIQTSSVFNQAQWAHGLIETEQAWIQSKGSNQLIVAVVDSGIDDTHVDLKNVIWKNELEVINGLDDDQNGYVDDVRGWNFVEKNNNPKTTNNSNHGTHVAGIIGAQGQTSSSVLGESKNVRLMALRFIGETGTGRTSDAIRAIDYAIQKKVFAINNSWGSVNRSEALSQAIRRAEEAGILFVAAAGNDGLNLSQTPFYPASFTHSNIISVAATQTNDRLTSFSNYDQESVDVAAPGSQILSTITGNRYMKMSGTSMATPFVTGLAVLVKAANQKLNFQEIISIIKSTVDQKMELFEKVQSKGRINARKAVNLAIQYNELCRSK